MTWPWEFLRVSLSRGLNSSSEQPLAARLTANTPCFGESHRTALYAGSSAGAKEGVPCPDDQVSQGVCRCACRRRLRGFGTERQREEDQRRLGQPVPRH